MISVRCGYCRASQPYRRTLSTGVSHIMACCTGPMNAAAVGVQPLNQLYFQDGVTKRVRGLDSTLKDLHPGSTCVVMIPGGVSDGKSESI